MGRRVSRAVRRLNRVWLFAAGAAVVLSAVVTGVVMTRPGNEPATLVAESTAAEPKALAKKQYERGEYKKALPRLERLVGEDAEDIESQVMLASAFWLDGQLDKASKLYEKILEVNPDDADSRYRLGILLRQQNELDRAVAELEEAAKLRPDSPLFLGELAKAYVKQGRYAEAIDNLERSLEAYGGENPAAAGVYTEIGDTYLLMENSSGARRAYNTALGIDPDNNYLKSQLRKN